MSGGGTAVSVDLQGSRSTEEQLKFVTLTQEDVESYRGLFFEADPENRGYIEQWKIKGILQALRLDIADDDLFMLLSDSSFGESTNDCSGSSSGGHSEAASSSSSSSSSRSAGLDFPQYLSFMKTAREFVLNINNDSELVDAFVVLGGKPDRTGHVHFEKLADIIRKFGLSIDERKLYADTDKDKSGLVDYSEFRQLLSHTYSGDDQLL
eukprot:ANDGO_00641.mRNA.1 flagellar outer arm